jgi:DNA (cytosine-5)-methyltransferase 1
MSGQVRFGSVCSGIEAASVAWHPLGWQAAWFAEIEPFPSAVLRHHYPDVANLGDMTALPELIRSGAVEAPDLLCGGTPCQAFSVAGLRRSLDDARGNLTLTFCEIADAIDTARHICGAPAAVIFWENVPGVLSTRDNAFGCFLGQLVGGTEPLYAADGWTDAGVVSGPRRTAAWRVLDAQFFGVAQRRRRVFVVASARAGFDPAAVLFEFDGVRRDSAPSREAGQGAAPTIDASFGRLQGCSGQDANHGHGHLISMCLNGGGQNRLDAESETLIPTIGGGFDVAHSLRGEGFDASQDGTGRGTPLVPVVGAICGDSFSGGMGGRPEGAAAGHVLPVVVAALTASGRGVERTGESRGQDPLVLAPTMQVRRLTPTECERLQGFPDGYTNIPWRGKPASECPDGPRYKALGNSWAVPVVRWIGQRINSAVQEAA